jgi:muramidase (phage lysozyme)
MIAVSELTARLLVLSDNGYNVLVGSTPDHPRLFSSYVDHPRQLIDLPRLGIKSTAAGRYQILARFFDAYKKQLGLKDFSPASQDAIAVQMIRECGALQDIELGLLATAINKCRKRWASLPGAGYGQNENDFDTLALAFRRSGGVVA